MVTTQLLDYQLFTIKKIQNQNQNQKNKTDKQKKNHATKTTIKQTKIEKEKACNKKKENKYSILACNSSFAIQFCLT